MSIDRYQHRRKLKFDNFAERNIVTREILGETVATEYELQIADLQVGDFDLIPIELTRIIKKRCLLF